MSEAKTVDLAELTRRLGLEAHERHGVEAFVGGPGPWTEADAATLEEIWRNTDPATGVYTEPAQEPRRALFSDGRPIWQHGCGAAKPSEDRPRDAACAWCYRSGPWQQLYTLQGPAPAPAPIPVHASALPDEGSLLRPTGDDAGAALLWRHSCGVVSGWRAPDRPNYCTACDGRGSRGWRKLFLVEGQ